MTNGRSQLRTRSGRPGQLSHTARTHWLTRVAQRAGLNGAEAIQLDPTATAKDAWSAVGQCCEISDERLAELVAAEFRLRVAALDRVEPKALKLVPASVAKRFQVCPIHEDDRQLVVATSNPMDLDSERDVQFASGRNPILEVASPIALERAIATHYAPDRAVEALLRSLDVQGGDSIRLLEETGRTAIDAQELTSGPVVKLANLILRDAITQGASDVHLQCDSGGGVVRFRIDGVMRRHVQMPIPALERVMSRLKIVGDIDIADRLRPHDGRARVALGHRTYDLRMSTVPTRGSEKLVIRILDPERASTLEDLELPALERARFEQLLGHRDGIVIVTGPTGSGKTSTMYAALRRLATGDVNIMTVEDPVEFEIQGLTQIQVEPKQGVTFASALRAILRQDPDIIFVGEIRDAETAEVAVQASRTGHLVLATLHTNDAVGALSRLADLGLNSAAIGETFRGAMGQRLARRVCSHCRSRVEGTSTPEERRLQERYGVRDTARAAGCDQCEYSGYRGRVPLVEVFAMDSELKELIVAGAPAHRMTAAAVAHGMRSLRNGALERVRNGETTLEEVDRVLGSVTEEEVVDGEPPTDPHVATLADIKREAAFGESPQHAPLPDVTAPPPPQEKGHIMVVDDDGVRSDNGTRVAREKWVYGVGSAGWRPRTRVTENGR